MIDGTESIFKNKEFSLSLARIAVAQICESLGFQGFQLSALDTLSDITCKYIQDIGKLSNCYANLAGRSESNLCDVVHGLEEFTLSQGFIGGSGLDYCLSDSGIVKEISRYIDESEEVGFAYSVPCFPVVKERELTPSFFRASETPPVDHIPPWLPCFIDPQTCTSSGSASIVETETKLDEVDQDQKVDRSLSLESEQRLACKELKVPSFVEPGRYSGKARVNSAFLASPLEYEEMKVSFVSLPARLVEEDVAQNHILWAKHVSALWKFAPAIHGLKSYDLDTCDGSKEIAAERRSRVQLKFHVRKNANKRRRIKNTEPMCWFDNDDSKSDKKMTKETIVKDSSENGKQAY